MSSFSTEPRIKPSPADTSFMPNEGLLRFSTAGSVDDGKSTLIGRLLYDNQSVFEDQLASVKKSKVNRSTGPIDFSLLTDGLRAEREQGITIDVAYRYFSTPRRKFIIADTPGHEQYTRNMATGASTADAAVVLIDATKGVLRQSRRHAYIASLLGVQYIIAAVNKMDLVDYSREVFERLSSDFNELAAHLQVRNVYAIPVSALEGDNVVHRSARMPWFDGPSLLEYLEKIPVNDTASFGPLRFPVQYVIRPDASFRGFAGRVASGVLRPGTDVVAMPSGLKTKVKSIVSFDGEKEQTGPGDSVTLTLEDEIDISRGDMLVAEEELPAVGNEFRAKLVWMHADKLDLHKSYLLKHSTRSVRGRVIQIHYRVDMNTLEKGAAEQLEMNDVAEVEIKTALPLFFDPYRQNRTTGSFILIDPASNATVAAGIIEQGINWGTALRSAAGAQRRGRSTKEERHARFGHPAAAVWVNGSAHIAELIERTLFDEGWHVQLVGPDDLAPSELGVAAKAYHLAGMVVVFSAPAAEREAEEAVRNAFGRGAFLTAWPYPHEEDADAAARIASKLRQWRDTQEQHHHRGSKGD
ncbi:MAG TPA: sulfate adenylyltransferase subunit CysN [Candidatus Aquilonibacter sp.]|nr:sulfate adenylyltransferase subunit CysN [Candidatus Aquilonibacter sp.]